MQRSPVLDSDESSKGWVADRTGWSFPVFLLRERDETFAPELRRPWRRLLEEQVGR